MLGCRKELPVSTGPGERREAGYGAGRWDLRPPHCGEALEMLA